MKNLVSIIIVHYQVKKELFDCLTSILDSKPKTAYEIIVVDNDEIKTIKKDLLKAFPNVVYIPNENKGFGQGNNVGAKHAKGDYLFFLNPDTILITNCIDLLRNYLETQKNVGIVAPVLYDKSKKSFALQGLGKLTPTNAIFSLSFLNTLFPNNPISRNYWNKDWDKKSIKEVYSIPGTAFVVKKKVFEKIGGFDEHFFLYFEEMDFCKRVSELGLTIIMYPSAKVYHAHGSSTKKSNANIDAIFKRSRFYYFKKHFGFISAFFTELVLTTGKYSLVSFGILLLAAFLLFFRIGIYMPFIGDQGWFYLSARDMILTGKIPLVGITSSHVWLHQGPYWTYMLAGMLLIGHFNPVSGAYLTAAIGLITVWLVYKFGSEMFSQRTGLVASLLYATSPEIISFARMPYHTEFIAPLTLLLFYTLYKWINGYRYGFVLIILLLALLYNFETATFMLFPIVLLVIIYGVVKKTAWVRTILSKKILLLSFFAWFIPMIPMILYDTSHGYPQTLKFTEWVVYKIATVFGFPKLHPDAPEETFQAMIPFASNIVQRMVFLSNALVAWVILGVSLINLLQINKKFYKKHEFLHQYSLLLSFFIIPAIIYIAERTNSDAYWIVFFPIVSFMLALVFDRLMSLRIFFIPALGLLFLLVFLNIYALLQTNYLIGRNGITFSKNLTLAEQIIHDSQGKEYNLIGRGSGSEYSSFTMNYEYLTWWMGHGPSDSKERLRFVIEETPTTIIVSKQVLSIKK